MGTGGHGTTPPPRAAAEHQVAAVTITVTCLSDGRAHAVVDSEIAGGASHGGQYRAVCGHVITAAPMVEPDGKPCRQCVDARPSREQNHRPLPYRLLGI